jgi:hypothetical protein
MRLRVFQLVISKIRDLGTVSQPVRQFGELTLYPSIPGTSQIHTHKNDERTHGL